MPERRHAPIVGERTMRSMRGAYSFFFSPSPSFFGGALSGSAFSLPEVGSCRRSLSFLVVRPPYCESGSRRQMRPAGGEARPRLQLVG